MNLLLSVLRLPMPQLFHHIFLYDSQFIYKLLLRGGYRGTRQILGYRYPGSGCLLGRILSWELYRILRNQNHFHPNQIY